MNTVYRAVVALLGFTALVLGGTATPVSAISEHPTPVYFAAVHNAPHTLDLYDTMPAGTKVRQELGTTVEHPKTVCPRNRHFRLTWSYKASGPREVYRLKPGVCLWPGPGPVFVEVWRVK